MSHDISDIKLGGGEYKCEKCGVTVFGSALHYCNYKDDLRQDKSEKYLSEQKEMDRKRSLVMDHKTIKHYETRIAELEDVLKFYSIREYYFLKEKNDNTPIGNDNGKKARDILTTFDEYTVEDFNETK